jgi:hypothetical protein
MKLTILILVSFSSIIIPDCLANDRDLVVRFLRKYKYGDGYDDDDERNETMTDEELANGVKQLQKLFDLPLTGTIDDDIVRIVKAPRCGITDENLFESSTMMNVEFNDNGWLSFDLTWALRNTHPRLPYAAQFHAIRQAFRTWSEYTPFRFTELPATDSKVDIELSFEEPFHKPYPFNGDLAHASYPDSRYNKQVYIHFNKAYTFTLSHDRTGQGLYKIALHEIGHALGLRHSKNPSSIMFTRISNVMYPFRISDEDVNALKLKYKNLMNSRNSNGNDNDNDKDDDYFIDDKIITTPREEEEDDSNNNNDNDGKEGNKFISTIIQNELFMFHKSYFWRSNVPIDNDEHKALSVNRMFDFGRNIDGIDAIYQRSRDGRIIIFVGKEYFVFHGRKLESGPNSIAKDFDIHRRVSGAYPATSSSTRSKSIVFLVDDSGTVTKYDDRKRSVVRKIRTNANAVNSMNFMDNNDDDRSSQHYNLASITTTNDSTDHKYYSSVILVIISTLAMTLV